MIGMEWLQLAILIVVLTLLVKPVGIYLSYVLDPVGKTWLDPILKPIEKMTYRLVGVDPSRQQTWKEYLWSLLSFSFISCLITFLLLLLQPFLPLNPQHQKALSVDLCFNTAVSFMTNTNWQSYGGESTMSYFSQMVTLTFQNFASPAVGLCVIAVLARAFKSHAQEGIGHFWIDLIRCTYYFLLPLAFLYAIFFVSQGVPQNFDPYVEGDIVQGPIASQEAIKVLGTNGGGYTATNSAHPYENPTPLVNFFQILCILMIPAAQTYYFGKEIKNYRHGWSLYAVMLMVFVIAAVFCIHCEKKISPYFSDISGGNMEGKEVRFGIFGSALFATTTTMTSCGAVNSMHDSFMPLGGMVPLLSMELGESIFGGVGAGLYSIFVFVIAMLFIAGLVIGRTPEYLGKRVDAYEIKWALVPLIGFYVVILGFTAWAISSSWGQKGLGNNGSHGFSEVLYAYSSCAANNGSAFGGLSTNTPWYNYTMGIVMLVGRFFTMVPVLAIAGSFAQKKAIPMGPASFPVSGITFVLLLIGVVAIIGLLAFAPALCYGPILEALFLKGGKLF